MVTKVSERLLEPGFLDKIRARPALSEREIIDRAIEFANQGTLRTWCKLMEGIEVPELVGTPEPYSDGINTERQALRSALAAIVENKVSEVAAAEWCKQASGVLPIETYSIHGRSLRVTYHYEVVEHFTGINGLLARVLVWLLDANRPFGRELCRCHLEECGNFFFVIRPKTGRPQKLYCKREHMTMAHQATTAERGRRSREKRKQKHAIKKRRRQ